MYELVQVAPRTYYIQCPAKMGVYVPDGRHACLIDSGNDKDAGKKALRVLTQNGWTLSCIVNTHAHADHIGGNRYLQAQTGCRIYAGGIEAAFARTPILEPAFLYGGFPPQALRHKFLMAQESDVLPLGGEGFPEELEILPLPGHSFDMIGVRTPDDVVFLADCLASAQTLEKYAVSVLYDVEAYLQTLERVKTLHAACFVPAHAEPTQDIRPLAQRNQDQVQEIIGVLLERLQTPATFETVLAQVFTYYGLVMTAEQHALVGFTLRSYLAYLWDTGRIDARFEGNRMVFFRV